jgi:hypothetical protein
MNILSIKAYHNLNILSGLSKEDNLNAERGELIIQDEFVQVDNIEEIEYSIYFTYHQILSSIEMKQYLNTDLIEKLDKCIDTIFDNEQLNGLMEIDPKFKEIIDDLDSKIYELKNSYFYKSPFFNVMRVIYNKYDYIKNIMQENNEYVSKLLSVPLHTINKDINREYYSDDDLDDETTADETTADETTADETTADETTADETTADETTADETTADETNPETGEINPNLIYDDKKLN